MTRFTDEILEHLGIDLPSEVSRRKFLKIFGGGIVVTVSANDLLALQEAPARRRFGRALPDDFNAFLRVGEDGRVTCFTGKIEMGQGVVTSLAQMLADELEISLDSVDMVMGDTDLCPWDMGTFGSMSTRFFGPPLRAAAAEAREVLLEQAAERLDVPVKSSSVRRTHRSIRSSSTSSTVILPLNEKRIGSVIGPPKINWNLSAESYHLRGASNQ